MSELWSESRLVILDQEAAADSADDDDDDDDDDDCKLNFNSCIEKEYIFKHWKVGVDGRNEGHPWWEY